MMLLIMPFLHPQEGMTALHVAITDRLYKDGKGGKSRLMTGKQKYPMVEFLLRYGADVNATCKVGTSINRYLVLPEELILS